MDSLMTDEGDMYTIHTLTYAWYKPIQCLSLWRVSCWTQPWMNLISLIDWSIYPLIGWFIDWLIEISFIQSFVNFVLLEIIDLLLVLTPQRMNHYNDGIWASTKYRTWQKQAHLAENGNEKRLICSNCTQKIRNTENELFPAREKNTMWCKGHSTR